MEYEQQVAGAGYVLSFFNDIEQLSNYYAQYINTVLSFERKYPNNKALEGMSEEDRQALIATVQGLRTWIIRCFVKAQALKEKVENFTSDEFEEIYRKVTSNFIPEREDVESFVIEINKAFVNGMLVDLLNRARDVYARLTE